MRFTALEDGSICASADSVSDIHHFHTLLGKFPIGVSCCGDLDEDHCHIIPYAVMPAHIFILWWIGDAEGDFDIRFIK